MSRKRPLVLIPAVAVLIALMAIAATLGTGAQKSLKSGGTAEWRLPNGDLQNHRVADSKIDSTNVSGLEVAWTKDVTGASLYGSFASMPIIANGTVYLQDLQSNVTAVDLASGETKWTRAYDEPVIGPNGLNLQGGTLYGVTATSVFALNAADGTELWRTKPPGVTGTQITGAPAVHNGQVYAGTITRPGGGLVFALDAKTGAARWTFNTLKDPSVIPAGNLGGGVWNTPLVDPRGDVYFGTGNAYTTPRALLEHPTPLLYTNSLLKLSRDSGQLKWYYQAVPNDFYDWDLHLSPMWIPHQKRPMVVTAGKMGYIYAINPSSGQLIWKTPVGDHNGRDNDSRKALENPGSVTITPPIKVEPGVYGGVETNMAYEDGVVYAAISNLATTLSDLDVNYGGATGTFDYTDNSGEFLAIDVKTGRVLWTTKLPTMAFGAATVSNDLVFTTTFDGTVYAFSKKDGSIVWQDKLPTRTNAPLTIAGDTLVTAASYPAEPGQVPKIVAYRLGGSAR
jgi:outer membrane protein assembly factor BamB